MTKKKKKKPKGKIVNWWEVQPAVPKTDPRWLPEKSEKKK
jgi:hypothetical protein